MDHLGLVESVDRLGKSIIVAIADVVDGGLDPGLREALGVADADVLRSAVRMMHQAGPVGGPVRDAVWAEPPVRMTRWVRISDSVSAWIFSASPRRELLIAWFRSAFSPRCLVIRRGGGIFPS
jgi:hypothetical protein